MGTSTLWVGWDRGSTTKTSFLLGIKWNIQICTEKSCFNLLPTTGFRGGGSRVKYKRIARKCMKYAISKKCFCKDLNEMSRSAEWSYVSNPQAHGVGAKFHKICIWELNELCRSAQKNHVCQPSPLEVGINFPKNSFARNKMNYWQKSDVSNPHPMGWEWR